MNNPDTDWIKEGVEAVVMIARGPDKAGDVLIRRSRSGDYSFWIPQSALRPLPPPLSPTAQRVVEAAMAYRDEFPAAMPREPNNSYAKLLAAIDAHAEHLATLRPADPLAVAGKLIERALAFAQEFARDNPKYVDWVLGNQDPSGVHAWLAEARAAILLIERAGQGEG